jgi:hypothetical protein
MIPGHNSRRRLIILAITTPFLFLTLLIAVIEDVDGTNANILPLGLDNGQMQPSASPGGEVAASEIITGEASCRVGVVSRGTDHVKWVDDLGAGWFVFFGGFSDSATNGAEIAPVIDVRQKKDAQGNYLDDFEVNPPLTDGGLGGLVDYNPGVLWLVGNEVDRGPNPGGHSVGQGDTFPQVYARAYYSVYHFIKDRDPTAQVAISGLVEATPGRLEYLEIVWQTYLDLYGVPMPVDVWNMHLYILPELLPGGQPNGIASVALGTNPALGIRESNNDPTQCSRPDVYCIAEHDDMEIFDQQVRAMRGWMRSHNQQNKPLILSEYSILYPYVLDPGGTCWLQDEYGECFTPTRIAIYLNETMSYFETAKDPEIGYPLDDFRLVQQTAWFSINNENRVGNVSDLVVDDENNGSLIGLSSVGEIFKGHALSESLYVNLRLGDLATPVGRVIEPAQSTSVTLRVDVGNNGTIAVTESFSVTFYASISPTEVIGTVNVPMLELPEQELAGCGRRQYRVSVDWSGLVSGTHPYWVEVDSGDQIEENVFGDDGEEDNIAMGIVLIDQDRFFFPLMYQTTRSNQ